LFSLEKIETLSARKANLIETLSTTTISKNGEQVLPLAQSKPMPKISRTFFLALITLSTLSEILLVAGVHPNWPTTF
jgi:hypothetical protein